jgi:type I restriction enzyme S subunit
MATVEELANIKRDIGAIFGLSVYGLGDKCQMMKMGDIVKIKRGKSLPRNNIITGEYPVIGGGVQYSGYHNEFNYNGNNGIFISRVGTAGYVSRYMNKCYITDLIFVIEPNENININYLYLYLVANRYKIETLRATNAAPNISLSNLQNLEIQQQIINKINKLNEQSSQYDQYAKFIVSFLETYT